MLIKFKAAEATMSGTTRGNGASAVKVWLSLDDVDASELFNQLWDTYGDDWLKKEIETQSKDYKLRLPHERD